VQASRESEAAIAEAAELSSNLSSAICSLVEFRLDRAEDLCEVAESCTELLRQVCAIAILACCYMCFMLLAASPVAEHAIQVRGTSLQACTICPGNPEPLQALASIQYEQGDMDAALKTLQGSIGKWWRPVPGPPDAVLSEEQGACLPASPADPEAAKAARREVTKAEGSQADGAESPPATEAEDVPEDMQAGLAQPSYEFRVECCKLLLELDTTVDTVIQVLSSKL
jgi:hypothetical protein